MKTKFTFLTGDINWQTYGGKWVTPKLNNGDFDYWIVLEFINMHDATGEENGPKYHVSLAAVSPTQAGDNLQKAFECCGIEPDSDTAKNELCQVECLHSYGTTAHLWQQSGNNASKLMAEAKKQAQVCSGLFGFYMDEPKNKIGTTGWEAIKGDIDSGLARTIASGSPEGRILGKMYGV